MLLLDNEKRDLDLQRLDYLERQAALHGPKTDPAILIELQELLHNYPERKKQRKKWLDLDIDMTINTVAATLQRFTIIENEFQSDKKARKERQFKQDVWMVSITILVTAQIAVTLLLIWLVVGLAT